MEKIKGRFIPLFYYALISLHGAMMVSYIVQSDKIYLYFEIASALLQKKMRTFLSARINGNEYWSIISCCCVVQRPLGVITHLNTVITKERGYKLPLKLGGFNCKLLSNQTPSDGKNGCFTIFE